MSYYDTIEEDLARAKAILAKGKPELDSAAALFPEPIRAAILEGGTIYGADTYAAYKLLASFVAEIERLQAHDAMITCPLCEWSARNEVADDPEARARIEQHLRRAFVAHVQRQHPA